MKSLYITLLITLVHILPLLAQETTFKTYIHGKAEVGKELRIHFEISTPKGITIAQPHHGPLPSSFHIIENINKSATQTYTTSNTTTSETTITETYAVVCIPLESGFFVLPGATVQVGDSTYTTAPLEIEVKPSQSQEIADPDTFKINEDDLFVNMTIHQTSPFVNEGILVTYKLYTTLQVTQINKIQFPNFEGFISHEIDLPSDREMGLEYYQGKLYKVFEMRHYVLYPLHAGTIPIGHATFTFEIQQPEQYDLISLFRIPRKSQVSVVCKEKNVEVKPLPDRAPASFTTVVGQGYQIAATITPEQTGAYLYQLQMTGRGNLPDVPEPNITFPATIEARRQPNQLQIQVDSNGVSGSKTFQYLLYPQQPGTITIPSAVLSYFDTPSKTYKTIRSKQQKIKGKHPKTIGSEEEKTATKNILFVIDVSGSMKAKDLQPSRMEAIKEAISSFLRSHVSENEDTAIPFGIIAFARESCIPCAFTTDLAKLTKKLSQIDSTTLQEGTAIGEGIMVGVGVGYTQQVADPIIILITDGTNNTGRTSPADATEMAAAMNVKIYTIGIGANGTAPVPFQTPEGVKYIDLPVEIDENTLVNIAQKTAGSYTRVTNNEELSQAIEQIWTIETQSKSDHQQPLNHPGSKSETWDWMKSRAEEYYYNTKPCTAVNPMNE